MDRIHEYLIDCCKPSRCGSAAPCKMYGFYKLGAIGIDCCNYKVAWDYAIDRQSLPVNFGAIQKPLRGASPVPILCHGRI